jgi:hypothetical protein
MDEQVFALTSEPLVPGWAPPEIDISVQHSARIYDYLLGGKNNFPVDRAAAEAALRVAPDVRTMARANRAFLGRAVRFLADAGISQFLDLGTGIPSPGNTGEVARAVHPDARVVYVDNDPLVAVHSRALLADVDPRLTGVVTADVRDPAAILADPVVRSVLDFDRPIAVMLISMLHFVPDEDDPAGIVAKFVDAVAPGSALAVSHAIESTLPADRSAELAKSWTTNTMRTAARTAKEVEELFTGVALVEPGLVSVTEWRPEAPGSGMAADPADAEAADGGWLTVLGGVGFKRD